jgi:hypothetical protein
MNMLFPSTKQRPDFHRTRAAHSVFLNPQLELNLCTNSYGPSHRDLASGLFSHGSKPDGRSRKALSLADFAKQLANS